MIKESYIICQIFKDRPVDVIEAWEELFDKGTTKFFEYGFITHFEEDGVLYINSASVKDVQFSRSMQVYMWRLVKGKEDVVISSSVRGIRTLLKLGFEYDYVNELYIKGTKYYKQIAEKRRR